MYDDHQQEQLASHKLSIGNVTHKLQFYTVDSNNDLIWLSPKVIEQFDRWGHDKIGLLNNDFDLDTGIIEWRNDKSCKITECFSETLYFLYMFLNGHLMGSPLSHRVDYGYFASMHNVLLELCIRGVYVLEGVEPVKGKTPSQCAFIVLIRNEVTIPFMDMMESIYAHNINVNARKIKAGKVILQYNKNINNRMMGSFKVDTSLLCERLDMQGSIGMSKNTHAYNFSLWHVKIWSQSVKDHVHVEDMLLHLWIKFNSMYGYANNDMLVT
jgi:hypothetical protein